MMVVSDATRGIIMQTDNDRINRRKYDIYHLNLLRLQQQEMQVTNDFGHFARDIFAATMSKQFVDILLVEKWSSPIHKIKI